MRLCELTGCKNERPVRIPFCPGHYNRLPKAFKRKLRALRRSGQEYGMVQPANQYLATVRAAHDWLLVEVEHKRCPEGGCNLPACERRAKCRTWHPGCGDRVLN